MKSERSRLLTPSRSVQGGKVKTMVATTTARSFMQAEETKSSISNYIFGRQIGRGAYSTVRLATYKPTKEPVAVKSYDKFRITDVQKRTNIRREIKILSKLDHPNTIKVLETIDTNRDINIVMEYVGLNSLHGHMRKKCAMRCTEEEAKPIFRQIVEAIHYCHSKNITHRDIKMENVIIDQCKNIKIIDFGFATCMPPERKIRFFCGTPSYMAPEIVTHKEYTGPPVDVWALGILLFTILTGTYPFKGANDRDLYKKISSGHFHMPSCVTSSAAELIRKMLTVDPLNRATCREVLDDIWLNS